MAKQPVPVPAPDAELLIPGTALAPSAAVPVAEEVFWFHCGLLPDCPRESVHVAGVAFMKVSESVLRSRSDGKTVRVPHAGQMVKLSRAKLHQLAEVLPRRVFRFVSTEPVGAAPGGENRDGAVQRLPQASMVSIPTSEALEHAARDAAKGLFRLVKPYVAQASDRPVADFLYLVHVDEVAPRERPIDCELPEPLGKTGLRLPPATARAVPAEERTTLAVASGDARGQFARN